MTDATSRLIRECRLLGAANVIVSTNVAVRRDGLPYARQRTPEDPGAAVYFKLESVPEGLVLACDRWLRVEDNIAAVAAHIGALRGIDRWGVGSVRQAFAGYKRLAAGDAPTPWWEVLGIDRQAPAVAVKQAYKELGLRVGPRSLALPVQTKPPVERPGARATISLPRKVLGPPSERG